MSTVTMPRVLDAGVYASTVSVAREPIDYRGRRRASFAVSVRRNTAVLRSIPRPSLPSISLRAVAVALLFFSAAASLSVGLIVLGWSGVDVIVNAGPLALIAAGGAAFAAMIIAINLREEN
jgi:hypothetical protein